MMIIMITTDSAAIITITSNVTTKQSYLMQWYLADPNSLGTHVANIEFTIKTQKFIEPTNKERTFSMSFD